MDTIGNSAKVEDSTNAIDTQVLEKAVQELASASFLEIGIEHHATKSRRSLQLLGNKDVNNSVISRREWFGYEFKEVIYLSSVEILTDGFGDYDEFELSSIDALTGTEKIISARVIDGKVVFSLGKFVLGFGFRPPSKYLVSPKLHSIEAFGLAPIELNTLINQFVQVAVIRDRVIRECEEYVERAAQADLKKTSLEDKILAIQTDLEIINTHVDTAKIQFETHETRIKDQVKDIEATNGLLAEKQTAILALENQIEQKAEERKGINQEVALANNSLSELKRDIHLFPSEIAGYVKQGARNIWLYVGLSAIPFVVICAVTIKLFVNSENMLSAFIANPNIPIVDYLLSRLPYAVVSTVILTVCYTLMHRLFAEIISISRKKQDLFKVSIIATDVSFASQKGLNLDEEMSYNLRTQTKMELLKEHLRQHLSDDYVYGKGSGLIDKALEFARKKLDTNAEEEAK